MAQMVRYQVILAYDGTDYSGFQRQKHTRTVQGEFEIALRKLDWQGASILAAGRTDAGVHASGQVVAFDLAWAHSLVDLQRALNAYLPHDVAVQAVEIVNPQFHPRYEATSRHYRYSIFASPVRNPLKERFAWRVWPSPEIKRLQQAAAVLVGTHDFAAFGMPHQKGGATERQIFHTKWDQNGVEFQFDIIGNAFLYRMVRRLVAYQLEVGWKHETIQNLEQHFVQPGDTSSVGVAPANGLCLVGVDYQSRRSENNLENRTELSSLKVEK